MNERSKKKRQERVRKQKVLQRATLMEERKKQRDEENLMLEQNKYFRKVSKERLAYQKDLEEVDILPTDNTLERNIKVLEAALADHEALQKYREEHKDEAEEFFQKAKQQSADNMRQFGGNNGTLEQ